MFITRHFHWCGELPLITSVCCFSLPELAISVPPIVPDTFEEEFRGDKGGDRITYINFFDFYLFLICLNKRISYIENNIGCVTIVDSPSLSLSVSVAERLFYKSDLSSYWITSRRHLST